MSLPGFDAIGRYALAQVPESANIQATVLQAAGIGTAGTFSIVTTHDFQPGGGVAGIGVAGSLAANPTALLIRDASVSGVAGSFTTTKAVTLPPAAGIGQAGNIFLRYVTATGAAGTGVAGAFASALQAFLPQAAGIGVAGIARGQSNAPTLIGVAGIGVVGGGSPAISVSVIVPGVAGIGAAGRITVTVSGAGTSRTMLPQTEPARARDPRMRAGLVPLAKRPLPPTVKRPERPLPPYRDPPPAALIPPPSIDVGPSAVSMMAEIGRQIEAARRETEARKRESEAKRRETEARQHDERDIAAVLAALERLD